MGEERKKWFADIFSIGIIVVLCIAAFALDYVNVSFFDDAFKDRMAGDILQRGSGALAAVLLMKRANIRLFGKLQGWLYLLPCLIVAVDNFRFWAYFTAETQPTLYGGVWDYVLFALQCLSVGLFEECIFRGIIFAVLAACFPKDKKGFLKTYFLSSLVFGAAHLFNLFGGASPVAVVIQVGYTFLTGGLFGFCLIKTKNIFCCAFVHGLYNFCGLLFSEQGLGTPLPLDFGTCLTMFIVSVLVGGFVLYKVVTYTDAERSCLYRKLGVKPTEKK